MVYIIFTNEQHADAEEIRDFLTEEKNLAASSSNLNWYELKNDNRIDQDAAVVLVSNAAVMDERWQDLVRDIPEYVRLIPVSSTRNADYTDPEMVPGKIREINYIRMGGRHLEDIWDSLTTEKGYYDIKNWILLNKNVWHFSKRSEDFLLSDGKKINEYLLLFQRKMKEEKNPYFQEEISEIICYLQVSRKYAKKLFRRKVMGYIRWAGAVAAAVITLITFIKINDYVQRARFANTIVSVGTHGEVAPVSAIKLIDGISNPLVSDLAKPELFNKLSEDLDMNWPNSLIGVNYGCALNDVRIEMDGRHIWSANGDGGVAKWDTYTGEVVWAERVSEQPLVALAISENEQLFVAMDFEGYLYKKYVGGTWKKSSKNYDIPPHDQTKLTCTGEKNTAAVAGENGKILYFGLRDGFTLLWEGQYDKVFCIEINGRGLEVIAQRGECLYDLCVREDGGTDEMPIPVKWDKSCTMDMRNGMVVMADQKNQIVTWSKENFEKVEPAGIVLSLPTHLCFVNNQTIAYHDRNMGTHLYDIKRRLDLGSVLENAVIVTSLSADSDLVMAYFRDSGLWCSENIRALLPIDYINEDAEYETYTEKEMSSAGRVRKVSVENEYIVRVVLEQDGEEIIYIIDGGSRYYVGTAQRDLSLVEEKGDNVFYFEDMPVYFTGKPTVIGITGQGEVLLVGGSDGSFFEIKFTGDKSFLRGCHFQIPSHAAVVAIYQSTDCYYLKDVTGTFWRTRIGYDALTQEGAVEAVKEKLHYAAGSDIYGTVSKETIKALNVKCLPDDDDDGQ